LLMAKFPSFTMYMKIGVEGIDHEVSENIEFTWDPDLPDEQNVKLMQAQSQVAQMKLQIGMMGLMSKLPEYLEQKALKEGIDFNDFL
jgi:hypothetical protein